MIELPCASTGAGPVLLEVTDDQDIVFYNWENEADDAAVALGFQPSLCQLIRTWFAHRTSRLSAANALLEWILSPEEDMHYPDSVVDPAALNAALIDAGFIDVLIALGADPCRKVGIERHNYLIEIAAMNDVPGAVAALVRHNAHVQDEGAAGEAALYQAIYWGRPKIARYLLLEADVSPEPDALYAAVIANDIEMVELLLSLGADPLWRNQIALKSALHELDEPLIADMILGRIHELEDEGYVRTEFPEKER